MCRNTKPHFKRVQSLSLRKKFAKYNWPLVDLLRCCQSVTNFFKMRSLIVIFCIVYLQHSLALSAKKYKRIMIEGGTWNSMQIRSHSDSEARGLVIVFDRKGISAEFQPAKVGRNCFSFSCNKIFKYAETASFGRSTLCRQI